MSEQQELIPQTPKRPQASPFDKWYSLYPKKRSRGAAVKAWEKLTKGMTLEEVEQFSLELRNATKAQIAYQQKASQGGDFVPEWPYPATWLNGMRWLDELDGGGEKGPHIEVKKCDECGEQALGPSFTKCQYHYSMSVESRNTVTSNDLREFYAGSDIRRKKGEPVSAWIRRMGEFVKQRHKEIGK
jgi:hypothetical protein